MADSELVGGALSSGFRVLSPMGWVVTGVLLAVTLVLFLHSARERRRNRALMTRLDDVEARLAAAPVAVARPVTDQPSDPVSAPAWVIDTPSGDALAGRTSDVARIIAGPLPAHRSLPEQAIITIYRHLDSGMTANDLARELFVSLRTLERGLAMSLGCTPRQLILAMRMREARRLLASGGCRVKDAAHRLGFADPYHFSRCFKAFYHVAPSEARPPARSI